MPAATFIRRHVNGLLAGEIFTTRDCLSYGTRAAVDQELYRLVKRGYIKRLAYGVFMRPDPSKKTPVSVLAVARIKAESFGKRIASHARDAACKLGIVGSGNQEVCFATNGSSSSFRFGGAVIHFRQTSQKKMIVGDRQAGLVIRALWYLGRSACRKTTVALTTATIGRAERSELRMRAAFMPGWLYRYFAMRN